MHHQAIVAEALMMLQGMNPVNQKEVDQKMFDLDGSDNKGKLGANAILAVSMAACKVCPMHHSLPGMLMSPSSYCFTTSSCPM